MNDTKSLRAKLQTTWRRALGLAILLPTLGATPTAHAADGWVGTWATAPEFTGPADMPQKTTLTGHAVRQVVHVSIGGTTLRLQLSNAFSSEPVEVRSVYIADAADGAAIDARTARYLKFGGSRAVTIAPGEAVFSDALPYPLKPLQRLAITVSYGQTPVNATSHRGARTTSYIAEGESRPKAAFNVVETLEHWYNIAAIDVLADGQQCFAVLGNSITDGRGTTTDRQNRWTDVCAEHLGGEVALLNLGIGGNAVLAGGLSEPAVKRFDRDIMGQRGLTGIIIYEGINDIGASRNVEQTARDLISAYERFIGQARERGLTVVGATITPIGNTDYWSLFHEALRQEVNQWIRTSGRFDAVIDFDRTVSDPAQPTLMRADYQYDWLHPNADGYLAMGREAARVIATLKH